ncbi:MAG: hypothetical protein K2N72_11320 [Oscillospiraceae bacterium]|nr:hypothetical protein [Oscillospiraceae bacterium]
MEMLNGLGGMFGRIAPGMCRLAMNGQVAVKTSNGYKSYDPAKGVLTNCSSFVLDMGDDFFFLLPTGKVNKGDIILVGGKPKCVVEKGEDVITAINYEDSTVERIIPERHMFMGNAYFYGKIVSLLGNGKKGTGKIMKYMMISEMMKGGKTQNGMNPLLLMAMTGGKGGDLFEGLFDFEDGEADML